METTNAQGCPILPIDLLEARAILAEKFINRDHWIMIVHGSFVHLLIAIEEKYYSGEKNSDITLFSFVGRGEFFAVVAARKQHMLAYQLVSIIRQASDAKITEREILQRDLIVIARGDDILNAALELVSRLFLNDDLAIAP